MIAVDWATKIISIPKADTTLLQLNPIEIRELNLDTFRLALKSLEDSKEGMPFLDTHRHNTTVTIGGVTLARVIEIINGYTVTLEDGAYAVNLAGANSNVGDVLNLNTVQVRSANSAGLIQTREIEHASFGDAVHIDVANGSAGTLYPIGTPVKPSNNLPDVLLIAGLRGFDTIHVLGDLDIDTGDFTGKRFVGESETKTHIEVDAAAVTVGAEFEHAEVHGVVDGSATFHDCHVDDLTVTAPAHFDRCGLHSTDPIVLAGSGDVHFIDCHSMVPGSGTPVIDMGGDGPGLGMRGYMGGIQLINKTGAAAVSIDLVSGQVKLENTVTDGEIVVRGVGKLTDNSVGATVDSTHLVRPDQIAEAAASGIQ